MIKGIEALIGLQWSDTLNCLTLAMEVHKLITGRELKFKYRTGCAAESAAERSLEIREHIGEYADRVDIPETGDVALLNFYSSCHLITFVSPYEILHIPVNGTSRIHRFSSALQRHTECFYRWR